MNRQELIEYLRNPSSLKEEHLEELENIISEAPYFQSARILLAKGSKSLKSPQTKKRITSAAIYATDRPLLKKYIEGNLLFLTKPPVKQAKPETEKKKDVKKAEEKEQPPKSKKAPVKEKKEGGNNTAKKGLKIASKKPEVPNIPPSYNHIDDILEELKGDMSSLKSSRQKFADLQKEIEENEAVDEALNAALAKVDLSSLQEEEKETPPEKAIENKKKEEVQENKEVEDEEKTAESKEEKQVPETPEPEKNTLKEEKPSSKKKTDPKKESPAPVTDRDQKKPSEDTETKEETREEKRERYRDLAKQRIPRIGTSGSSSFFSDLSQVSENDYKKFESQIWGDEDDESKKSESGKKDDKKPEKKKEVNKKADSDKTPNTDGKPEPSSEQKEDTSDRRKKKVTETEVAKTQDKEANSEKDKTEKEDKGELIDKFLKDTPSISRQIKQESKSADLSETSAELDHEIASEYLAEIYLHQGNKKRAISIYEALMLKFPEKKSYFADLISKTK